eukprot:CAMPEP_0172441946 /NCGR_PEP_ID=MMETSP1065-20121228/2447_1 /TAXON_ID=265537 /ORGANISM="Amphiprora paludosa, Strain CCMP125" /LENGTH=490 /DNA_ID=CAMNT_0013191577 /DNA_START=158 /DNA_END=1630 /DNA_ORIENTATION=+
MMRYTFWHGRCDRSSDLHWLNEAEQSLRDDSFKTPLYVDGAGWSDDAIREEAAERLFGALGKNASATNLIFQNATLSDSMDQAFSQAMDRNTELRCLTLRNLSRPATLNGAANANNNNHHHRNQNTETYVVPASVCLKPHLESLTLSKVSMTEQTCRNLGQMIRDSTSLTSLTLDSVQIAREGLVSILAAIIMSHSLKTLKLNNLEWSKRDIQRLLLAVSFNRAITKLNLEGMRLDASDAQELANFLQRNKTVTELSLRKNCLTAEALRVLVSQGVLHNSTLRKLFVSRNPLGDPSAPHLVHLLTTCTTLQELCLVETKIKTTGCIEIAKALRYNKGLRILAMDGNYFEACSQQMLGSLQHNMELQRVLDRLPNILARQQDQYQTWQQVDVLLRANQADRKFLRNPHLQPKDMPFVLEGAGKQTDVFYHFFRNSGNQFPQPSDTSSGEHRPFVPSAALAAQQQKKVPLFANTKATAEPGRRRRAGNAPVA